MKKLIIFLFLVVSTLQSPQRKRTELRMDDDRLKFCEVLIDTGVRNLKKYAASHWDPLPVPGFKNSLPDLFSIKLSDGKLRGLKSIHSEHHSNIEGLPDGKTFDITIDLGVSNVSVEYIIAVDLLGVEITSGTAQILIKSLAMKIVIEVNLSEKHPMLKSFGIHDLESLDVKLDLKNVGPVGTIIEKIIDAIIGKFESRIGEILEDPLREKLSKMMQTVDIAILSE